MMQSQHTEFINIQKNDLLHFIKNAMIAHFLAGNEDTKFISADSKILKLRL